MASRGGSSLNQLVCARHESASGRVVSASASGVVAIGGGGSAAICLFDLEWPWEPSRLLPTDGRVVALEWQSAGDARRLAAAGDLGTLSLYDPAAGSGLASSLVARRRLPAEVDALGWSCTSAGKRTISALRQGDEDRDAINVCVYHDRSAKHCMTAGMCSRVVWIPWSESLIGAAALERDVIRKSLINMKAEREMCAGGATVDYE